MVGTRGYLCIFVFSFPSHVEAKFCDFIIGYLVVADGGLNF